MSHVQRLETVDDPSEEGSVGLPDFGDNIELSTFEQVLEMDDGDEPGEESFSHSIVYGFFQQAENTFKEIETNLDNSERGDLQKLSSLGHFLKGSSATLGLVKVKDGCERIQHLGARREDSGAAPTLDDTTALSRIRGTLTEVKASFKEVEKLLRRYYGESV
ncbi:MAG: hypothetical protein M1834_003099 [Cirrosporium novae-zelandiae]|nr:MAG: hypothetical protein M1834_003099 [Cirrosporium novae-zelandiae]